MLAVFLFKVLYAFISNVYTQQVFNAFLGVELDKETCPAAQIAYRLILDVNIMTGQSIF